MFAEDPSPEPPESAGEGRPSPPDGAATVGSHASYRFGLLLAALFGSFFFLGVGPEGAPGRAVVTVLNGGTLLLAFWVAEMKPRRLRLAAVLVAVAVAAAVGATLAGGGDSVVGVSAIVNGSLVALAPPAVVIGVARSFRAHGAVTVQAVAGALCFFLLVGLFFAFVYTAVDRLGGAPFFADGSNATGARAVYFSFTTLTTVGYGDLTARTNLGHTLSVTEALFGQIYLVTVVALIVSNVTPRRQLRR